MVNNVLGIKIDYRDYLDLTEYEVSPHTSGFLDLKENNQCYCLKLMREFMVAVYHYESSMPSDKPYGFWADVLSTLYGYFTTVPESRIKELCAVMTKHVYFDFELGVFEAPEHDSTLTDELRKKYLGWYVFVIRQEFREIPRHPQMKEALESKDVYTVSYYGDYSTFMFFKAITPDTIDLVFDRITYMMKTEREITEQMYNAMLSYQERTKPWIDFR